MILKIITNIYIYKIHTGEIIFQLNKNSNFNLISETNIILIERNISYPIKFFQMFQKINFDTQDFRSAIYSSFFFLHIYIYSNKRDGIPIQIFSIPSPSHRRYIEAFNLAKWLFDMAVQSTRIDFAI